MWRILRTPSKCIRATHMCGNTVRSKTVQNICVNRAGFCRPNSHRRRRKIRHSMRYPRASLKRNSPRQKKHLEGDWRLLSGQQDGTAGLIILSSTRGSPTLHKMLEAGGGKRSRAGIWIAGPLPRMKISGHRWGSARRQSWPGMGVQVGKAGSQATRCRADVRTPSRALQTA